jgi:4-alpha-glucanotransferase
MTRSCGVMVPLFSLRSSRSWGIGEFADVPAFATWLRRAGQTFLQVLPITEVPSGDTSPYSALTAMALDPIFIHVPSVEDFDAVGGVHAMDAAARSLLEEVTAAPRVRYRDVRALKDACLRRAFDRFRRVEVAGRSSHAERFAAFAEEDDWLGDYALFQALRARADLLPWWDWPEPLRSRDRDALCEARDDLADEMAYRKYAQWVAADQWRQARADAAPCKVFGDVPFMIGGDSPDVWARQNEFRFDATIGVPPDAFSETGQDWGLPPWRWEVMAANDFAWMRQRASRTAHLFDGFRLDHLVGLYRIYVRPVDKAQPPFFAPTDEPTQTWLGERLVSIYMAAGAEVIAEDLGTVPDFVRASLQQLRVPGFKVMRWERQWSVRGTPYIDPIDYPEISVATTGTHDTEPLRVWWESLEERDRREVLQVPSVQQWLARGEAPTAAIVRALLGARSAYAILPLHDIFGWTDRINTPALVQEENWTWTMPWHVDRWSHSAELTSRADLLAEWTRDAGRAPGETGN